MTRKLLLAIVLLFTINGIAQDQRWSVEANYSVIPPEGLGGRDNITDLGLRYRFIDLEFVALGVGLNAGFSRLRVKDNVATLSDTKSYFVQPKVFAEFRIPGIKRLRPNVGLGYSIVNRDFESNLSAWNDTNGGLNLNLGLSYDISKRFFVQVQYDFINLRDKNDFIFNGNEIQIDDVDKLNNLKLGIGIRF